MDYSITWGYVVQKMKEKYGICVESNEKFSFGELMLYMNRIWDDFFITKFEEENKNGSEIKCRNCF